jgi:hypothetical protein
MRWRIRISAYVGNGPFWDAWQAGLSLKGGGVKTPLQADQYVACPDRSKKEEPLRNDLQTANCFESTVSEYRRLGLSESDKCRGQVF